MSRSGILLRRRGGTGARRPVVTGLWPAAKLLGGVAILAVLVAKLGSRTVASALASIGPGAVLAALALGLLTTAASAARWCLVARSLGVALPLAPAVADCYRSTFLNSVLPAGVLGDVHRAVGHGRRIGDVGRGVRIVALERVTGQLAIVVLGVGVLAAARPALLVAALRPSGTGTAELLAALVTVAALGLVLARTPRAARLRGRISAALRAGLAEARGGVSAAWPALLGLSVVTLAGYLALFVVAARTAGVTAPLATVVPLLVLGLLAMVVPLNVGGWGPREGVLAVAFSTAGLGAAQGLATAVVYGVLGLVACLPGAVVLALPAVRPTPEPLTLERSAA